MTYDTWRLNKTQFCFGLIAWGGLVYFAIALVLSILAYNEHTLDYSFATNFLSDLGQSSSPESAIIFNPALILLGICLLPHSACLTVNQDHNAIWLRVFSAISALGIIGLGLTPWDTHAFLHYCFLAVWMIGLFATVFTFFSLLRRTQRSSILAFMLLATMVLTGIGYVLAGNIQLHVIFQKSLVAACFAWYFHFFCIASTTLVATVSTRRKKEEELAEQYMDKLRHSFRK